jgi:4-amino-4-deoxy-L-arabinose transferase-like glycosyltransferase
MSSIRPRPRLTGGQLALIVLLLIVQFALRTYHPMEQPAFVDENYHVRRAELAYQFDRNPVEFSNGKLLFYYWLGLFVPTGKSALAVGRLAVAIFSLITNAGVAAVARILFGRRAMLPALTLYALAPYAVFFERMALADPFAGGLATLAIWQCIRLARATAPSYRFGALIGLLVGAATLAKLTMLPLIPLPFLAGFLFSERPAARTPGAIRAWVWAVWRRYRRAWIAAFGAGGAMWALFLFGMLAYRLSGEQPKFFTRYLVDEPGARSLWTNIKDTFFSTNEYLTVFVVIAVFVLTVLLVWRRPISGGYVLIWLAALWLPVVILGNPIQTRYLMAGIPAVAVLFGGGCVMLIEVIPRRGHVTWLIAAALGVWALVFALPFAWQAADDPASLKLYKYDTYSYLSGPYAGWGTREALKFLVENGQRLPMTVEGQDEPVEKIPAVGVLQHCGSVSLHVTDDFAWSCIDAKNFPIGAIPADVREWGPLMEGVETWPFVYLVTEFSGTVPDELAQKWELVYASPRPLGGWTVAVWRVTEARP